MRASTLIKSLQALVFEYGDQDVHLKASGEAVRLLSPLKRGFVVKVGEPADEFQIE